VNTNTNSRRRWARRIVAAGALVLLGVGCGQGSVGVPPPADPGAAVAQFLAASKANDLQQMGRLWGTSKGPAAGRMPRDRLEKSLTIIHIYLEHESYVIEPGSSPADSPDERVVRVRITRKGCTPVVPFTVVRWKSGWLVKAIDLEAAGNPAIPCT
jgi:hypothetical protein